MAAVAAAIRRAVVANDAPAKGDAALKFGELHLVARQSIEDFERVRRGARRARDVFGVVKQGQGGPSGQGEHHSG